MNPLRPRSSRREGALLLADISGYTGSSRASQTHIGT